MVAWNIFFRKEVLELFKKHSTLECQYGFFSLLVRNRFFLPPAYGSSNDKSNRYHYWMTTLNPLPQRQDFALQQLCL